MLGDRIREARKAAGLTQDELGLAVGKTKSTVSLWENNKATPYIDNIEAIAAALHVSGGWLLGYDEEIEPEEVPVPASLELTHREASLILAFRNCEAVYQDLVEEILQNHSRR